MDQECTVWYIMTPPQPVTVSIDVPQSRATVYAYLDVMANHEAFTDHMLTNWRVSGPATGVGSKGKRIAHGTYTLSDLPGGGTHVEFEFALQKVPAIERPFVPLMRKMVR